MPYANTEEGRQKTRKSSLAYYYRNKEKVQARNAAWWKAHPEKRKEKERRRSARRKEYKIAYRKRYRAKNLDDVRRKNREWQQKQKLHRRNYMSRYYENNRDKFIAKSKAWYRENPGKHSVHMLKRRNKEAQCPENQIPVIQKWMKQIRANPFSRCHWCGTKVSGKKVHFDHVVALSKGGTHTIGNLCAACPDCNMTKHARQLSDWIVSGQPFLPL